MKLVRDGEDLRLSLDPREAHLLRYALERALFIDTPVAEQVSIAAFCSRALDLLAQKE